MLQNSGLNSAQMDFLRLLSFTTEEEVNELSQVVCDYYASKVDQEMERLWQDGKWSQEKIDQVLNEHLRTPYER